MDILDELTDLSGAPPHEVKAVADKAIKEIVRLREALQHIRSLATPPVRQSSLRSILEECVWLVNAALKETE